MKILYLTLILISYVSCAYTQVINGYAKVTSIAGATLNLSNVNEAADSFEDDEWVVLMQMQDNVINTTTNTITFGDLSSINSTGLYEIRQIDSHTETAGVPTSVTLKNVPNFTYNTCTNCSVQIITFREFGSPDYTTTGNMSALAWNGNVGGVLAFYVPGTLTLQHNLDADSDGFRGAATNAGSSVGCSGSSDFRVATNVNHADKGEGIYKATDVNYAAGRARILTGGGGGNSHNAGGGGGGNYTSGGDGGPGWPTCSPSAGGLGGLDMSGEITVGRVFMGGGGGAGEGNNGFATNGRNGGGIILIKANEIETVACAGITISANGGSVPGTGGNDGGGGGGAGGSIVFEVDTWSISGSCPLTISANGGDGGDVNTAATHGGGGGGGQGVIFFSTVAPTVNVTSETNNGEGGCNDGACSSSASPGGGVDGSGIMDILTGPLPVELIEFNGNKENEVVRLNWTTKSERNNAYFAIERSANGENWEEITTVSGSGNSTITHHYQAYDFNPIKGTSYYRLRQVDFNGEFEYSAPISILFSSTSIMAYPNPANDNINLVGEDVGSATIYMVDAVGKYIEITPEKHDENRLSFSVLGYSPGIYTLLLEQQNNSNSVIRITIIK